MIGNEFHCESGNESGGEQKTYVAHAAERADVDVRQHEIESADGRAIIDDCGSYRWSLSVEEDGTVRADKFSPDMGVHEFTTAFMTRSKHPETVTDLSPEDVVERYVGESRTPLSVEELLADVRDARKARGIQEVLA